MAESIAQLAAALARMQAELPKLERDRTVRVEPKDPKKEPYSYSYATLANLSETILPLLAKQGLSFAALPGIGSDGKMSLRYQLMHESGETLTGEFPISGEGGIQMIGGRITYARRYCLAAIAGVAADEDDESHLSEDAPPRTAQRAARPGPSPARPRDGVATAQRATRQPHAGLPPLPGEEEDVPAPGSGDAAAFSTAAEPPSAAGSPGPAADPPSAAGPPPKQGLVGLIRTHFRRLGFEDHEREERLVATAKLAGIDPVSLETTNGLSMALLHQVAAQLGKCRDRPALTALLTTGEKPP